MRVEQLHLARDLPAVRRIMQLQQDMERQEEEERARLGATQLVPLEELVARAF
jgi:predicted transcriptional regulator